MKQSFIMILILLIFFAPPLSVNLALDSARQIRFTEAREAAIGKITAEINTIDRSFDEAESLMRNLTRISESINQPEFFANGKLNEQKADFFMRQQIESLIPAFSFPVEIVCMNSADQTGTSSPIIHFGASLGLMPIAELVKIHGPDSPLLKTAAVAATLKISASHHSSIIPLLIKYIHEVYLGTANRAVIRNQSSSLLLTSERISDHLYLLALADVKKMTTIKNLINRVKFYEADGIGVGAITGRLKKPVFSKYFKDFPELASFIAKISQNSARQSESFSIFGHEIHISAFDVRKQCRFFAAVPILQASQKKSKSELLLLFFLFLLSFLALKLLVESFIFKRGTGVSIKIILPVTFLFLIILPVFAGLSLIGEFFHSSYANEKSRVADRLATDIKEIDLQSLDITRQVINSARSFDSIEKISRYCGIQYNGDDNLLCNELMNSYIKNSGSRQFTYIWFCADTKSLVKIKWYDKMFANDASERGGPMYAMFQNRFQEIINATSGRPGRANQTQGAKLDKEIKNELTRDFFIKALGPEAFYRFRQNNDFIFNIDARFTEHLIYSGPISYLGRPYAFASWQLNLGRNDINFPINRLSIDSSSPRLAFSGDERTFESTGFSLEKLNREFPLLVKMAQLAHSSRARVTSRTEADQKVIIAEAMPANYSLKTLAGSEQLQNYEVFASNLIRKSLLLLLVLASFGAMLAFAGAVYFTTPLRELTQATKKITGGNFTCRISKEHPDEFSNIGKAFNAMASRLEEGQRLRSYVSDSVLREVENTDESGINERAETRCATVIFSAICGFSEYQKNHSAVQVFALLQSHLQAADSATSLFGGEIDKMIEDKVMIVFEHDENQPVTDKAIRVADRIAEEMAVKTGSKIGAGINSGITVAGIMGAESARLSRTVVGDPVNLAARLAYLAIHRQDGGIIISGQLVNQLSENYTAEKLPISHVKGKTHSIEAFLIKPAIES